MNKFEGVANTLFVPLVARINISKKFPEYFYDEKALELEQYLPQGVDKGASEYSNMASVARYFNMDKTVLEFAKRYTECNIVYLGAGLETAYDRLSGNLQGVNWYECDLPEVIEARCKVFGQTVDFVVICLQHHKGYALQQLPGSYVSQVLIAGAPADTGKHFAHNALFIVEEGAGLGLLCPKVGIDIVEFTRSEVLFSFAVNDILSGCHHFFVQAERISVEPKGLVVCAGVVTVDTGFNGFALCKSGIEGGTAIGERRAVTGVEGVFKSVFLAPSVVGAEPAKIQVSVMLPVVVALLGGLTANDGGQIRLNFIAVCLPKGLGEIRCPREVIPHRMVGTQ